MLYLLDANVLISANNNYYPLDRLPVFWRWLISEGESGHTKIPFEIHNEIAVGNDKLAEWINKKEVRNSLILDEEVDRELINRVINKVYAPSLNYNDLKNASMDPFLIAYALKEKQRSVVTAETSKPTQICGKRRLPDACNDLNVQWLTDFRLYEIRNFRID